MGFLDKLFGNKKEEKETFDLKEEFNLVDEDDEDDYDDEDEYDEEEEAILDEQAIEQQVMMLKTYHEQDPQIVIEYKKHMVEQISDNPEALEMFNEAIRRFEAETGTSEVQEEDENFDDIEVGFFLERLLNKEETYYYENGWTTQNGHFNKIHFSYIKPTNTLNVLFVSNQDDMTQYKVFYKINSDETITDFKVLKDGLDITGDLTVDTFNLFEEFYYSKADIDSQIKIWVEKAWDKEDIIGRDNYSTVKNTDDGLVNVTFALNFDEVPMEQLEAYYRLNIPEYNNKVKLHTIKEVANEIMHYIYNDKIEFKYEYILKTIEKIESLEISYFDEERQPADYMKVTNAFSIPGQKDSFTEVYFDAYSGERNYEFIDIVYKDKRKKYKDYNKALSKLQDYAEILDYPTSLDKIKTEFFDVIFDLANKQAEVTKFENEDDYYDVAVRLENGEELNMRLGKYQKRIDMYIYDETDTPKVQKIMYVFK